MNHLSYCAPVYAIIFLVALGIEIMLLIRERKIRKISTQILEREHKRLKESYKKYEHLLKKESAPCSMEDSNDNKKD